MCKLKIEILLIVFLLSGITLYARQTDQSLSSLKGIKKIGVLVEKFNADIYKNGVSEDDIRQAAASLLRKNGIIVIPVSETKKIPGAPYLYINIGAIKSQHDELYAVCINVQLRQNVILSRDSTKEYFGIPTWSNSNIGIISKDKLNQIEDYVKEAVNIFINDYQTAND